MLLNHSDEIINRWVRQAEHDLENAKKNLDIEAYDVSLILCQQAVEKMLKALYIQERQEEPPRTHSLRKLIELTDMPDEALKLVVQLDSYYMVLRSTLVMLCLMKMLIKKMQRMESTKLKKSWN
jgi:HEPN domain-containing protein